MTKVDNKLDIILEYEARLHQEYEQQKYISYFAKQWVNNTIEKCKESIIQINDAIRNNRGAKKVLKAVLGKDSEGHDEFNKRMHKNEVFFIREREIMEECLIVSERMLKYIEEREK